ncbi:type II toxin-antitoxin system Phd/YefM family antitoxin [Clostridium sp. D33t1_170424_F3]|uniref:type II toxin-antitoxin system Phd/YefM family antitoxin n=1 Tax=Clostridium sp. D33t1_170424_F3 TaxID=2787099 RepID=UPI0018A8B70E|nr:type II toxin-antitoxin system Phd/YefM family antitoxin [Clostridium sp. D33t1_170424_F3]
MTNTNITNLRKNLFGYIDQAITYNDVINVNTKKGNAIIMSEEEYNSLMATLQIASVPGLTKTILAEAEEPLEEMVNADDLEW